MSRDTPLIFHQYLVRAYSNHNLVCMSSKKLRDYLLDTGLFLCHDLTMDRGATNQRFFFGAGFLLSSALILSSASFGKRCSASSLSLSLSASLGR